MYSHKFKLKNELEKHAKIEKELASIKSASEFTKKKVSFNEGTIKIPTVRFDDHESPVRRRRDSSSLMMFLTCSRYLS